MFRSLLLFGIIVMAAGSAVNRLLAYARTGEAAPVVLEWIRIYAGAMAAICLALLPQPIKVFPGALRDVLGVALPADARAEIIGQARRICADSPFQVLDVATVRSGRALFHLVYLKPAEPVTIEAFEAVRDRLAQAASPGRVALTPASDPPFGPAPRAQ